MAKGIGGEVEGDGSDNTGEHDRISDRDDGGRDITGEDSGSGDLSGESRESGGDGRGSGDVSRGTVITGYNVEVGGNGGGEDG